MEGVATESTAVRALERLRASVMGMIDGHPGSAERTVLFRLLTRIEMEKQSVLIEEEGEI
jgi:hypothetical protein